MQRSDKRFFVTISQSWIKKFDINCVCGLKSGRTNLNTVNTRYNRTYGKSFICSNDTGYKKIYQKHETWCFSKKMEISSFFSK